MASYDAPAAFTLLYISATSALGMRVFMSARSSGIMCGCLFDKAGRARTFVVFQTDHLFGRQLDPPFPGGDVLQRTAAVVVPLHCGVRSFMARRRCCSQDVWVCQSMALTDTVDALEQLNSCDIFGPLMFDPP